MNENGSTLCFFCTSVIMEDKPLCRNCQRPYCFEHRSPLDNSLCTECVNFANTSVKSEPLITEDGVVKQNARKITLSGEGWIRERSLIANMTDIELESYINARQEAVYEYEQLLDHARIMIGHAKHEQAEKYNKKLRARSERGKLLGAVDNVHKISGSSTVKEKSVRRYDI